MPRKTTAKPAASDRMQTFYAARAKEEQRMEALAKRIHAAADRAKLAGVYHGDGAYQSANRCMNEAVRGMVLALRYIQKKGWQVPGGPR